MQRRLPVYLLFDCSRSMAGEPIAAMEMGLQNLIGDLQCDPVCVESVWVSIILFSSAVELLTPLTWIDEIEIPPLDASGTTSLGEAIDFVSLQIDSEVKNTNDHQKGDWKPMVFVFTDGEPTDDWEVSVDTFHQSGKAVIVACGAGPGADDDVLRRLGHHAIRLHDTQPGTLANFMQWVSVSVTSRSRSVGVSSEDPELLPPPPQTEVIVP
ncbi:VWA domain-containing protein [Akkermansiaceae bacterium]|nr:VWA domain-containing protein [Akkermansiaceae bacterium]